MRSCGPLMQLLPGDLWHALAPPSALSFIALSAKTADKRLAAPQLSVVCLWSSFSPCLNHYCSYLGHLGVGMFFTVSTRTCLNPGCPDKANAL